MRRRLVPIAIYDIACWLMLAWLRAHARVEAGRLAVADGDPAWGSGVVRAAEEDAARVEQLIETLPDAWSVHDWHQAQQTLTQILESDPDTPGPLPRLRAWLASMESPHGDVE